MSKLVFLKFGVAGSILVLGSACCLPYRCPYHYNGDYCRGGENSTTFTPTTFTPTAFTTQSIPSDGWLEHLIQKGDTVHSLAKHYGRTVKELAQWNGLQYPYNTIYPGQTLKIWSPRFFSR